MQKKYFLITLIISLIISTTFSQEITKRKQIENKITLIKNNEKLIPLVRLDTLKIAYVSLTNNEKTPVFNSLQKYTKISFINIDEYKTIAKDFNLYIIPIYNLEEQDKPKILNIIENNKTIICSFDNDDKINYYSLFNKASSVILSFQNDTLTQDLTGQIIFGGIGANGKLQNTINETFTKGFGINTKGGIRFIYTTPAEVGLDSAFLYKKIDSIANYGIKQNGYPGCQIFIAKVQKVFFNKSYGYHTYDSIQKVQNSDIYDLASVTKISAPLPCLMKLYEQAYFDIDAKFSTYWKPFKNSNKENIIIRDVLCHQGQLTAWIPFYKSTKRKNGKYKWRTFKSDSTKNYNIKVAENLYLHKKYYKKVFKIIEKSPLTKEKKYKYSDLSFYLYPTIIENITNQDYETYLKENFYYKLGAYNLTYNPLKYFPKKNIIPTEDDKFFRKELIHGTVHDEGAILLGGISGHAGLFGNANDLAKLMQMYLNFGEYGDTRYINQETITEWTSYQYKDNENRRGIGFDKPLLEKKYRGTPSPDASELSFGHTGFTGTFVWADPENGLLIVFLSNRVYPTRENKNLWRKNIRTAIHQVLYDEIK